MWALAGMNWGPLLQLWSLPAKVNGYQQDGALVSVQVGAFTPITRYQRGLARGRCSPWSLHALPHVLPPRKLEELWMVRPTRMSQMGTLRNFLKGTELIMQGQDLNPAVWPQLLCPELSLSTFLAKLSSYARLQLFTESSPFPQTIKLGPQPKKLISSF